MQRRTFVSTIAAASLCVCAAGAAETRFEDIASNGDPLRASFNTDANRVRLVLLVSPT
jgi:hypothetical protein